MSKEEEIKQHLKDIFFEISKDLGVISNPTAPAFGSQNSGVMGSLTAPAFGG
jgi:hypothetical protein